MVNEIKKEAWLKLEGRHIGNYKKLHDLVWSGNLNASTKSLGVKARPVNTFGDSLRYDVTVEGYDDPNVEAAAKALKIVYEYAKSGMNSTHKLLSKFEPANLDELTAEHIGNLSEELEKQEQQTKSRLDRLELSDEAKQAIRYDDFMNIASDYLESAKVFQQAISAPEKKNWGAKEIQRDANPNQSSTNRR